MSFDSLLNTYRPLDDGELRANTRYMLVFCAVLALFATGVAVAVLMHIVWIAIIGAGIALTAYYVITRRYGLRFENRFGPRFNALRMIVGFYLLYQGTAYRGLYGIYNRLYNGGLYTYPFASFALLTAGMFAAIFVVSNVSLNHITEPRKACLLGFLETLAFIIALGALISLLLYK